MRKVAARKLWRWAALRNRASGPSALWGRSPFSCSPSSSHSSPCRKGWLNSESASATGPERLSSSPVFWSAPWPRSSLRPRWEVTRRQVASARPASLDDTHRSRRSFGGSRRAASSLALRGPRSSNTLRTALAAHDRGTRSPSIRAGLPRRSTPCFISVTSHFEEFQ